MNHCGACGAPVRVHTGGEGTSSYVRIEEALLRALAAWDAEFRPEDANDEDGWRRWGAGICDQLDDLEPVLRESGS